MPATKTKRLLLFILFVFLQTDHFSFSQPATSQIKEWIKKLKTPDKIDDEGFLEVSRQMANKDSGFLNEALDEMKNARPVSHYYNARLLVLNATQVYRFYYPGKASLVKQYFDQALNEAYRTGDPLFIGSVCKKYAATMYAYQELEVSATYYLTADEMNNRAGTDPKNLFGLWALLGEVLFHTHEYEKSIYYLQKGLNNWSDSLVVSQIPESGKPGPDFRMLCWNAMGQDHQQLGQLDSALADYQKSMQLANVLNNPVWKGINSGFMGQVFFLRKEYDKAKPLLRYDYSVNEVVEKNIAAYSLHWLAKISLAQGEKDSALMQLQQALNLLRQSNQFRLQQASYLEHVYYAIADVYRAKNNSDSFYHYFQLYSSLHDSLERVAVLSSIKMAQVRIDNEKNYYAVQTLQREKKAEVLKRNFILIAIMMFAVIMILVLNRQRQRSIHKQELALQQKVTAEAEVAAAKEQLNMFKVNIIEKTSLIEKLREQVQYKELSAEQSEIAEELSRQTILTEEDWDKFKKLFEKIYPGFFMKLKEKSTEITVAEQRMAALTRLHLTTKQMASMLGISVDSVHKTRQRLRQRLQLGADINLEETIAHL